MDGISCIKKKSVKVFGSLGSKQGEFNNPYGIISDSKNNHRIIVSDYLNHRIQIFDQNGQYLNQFGSKGNNNGEFNQGSFSSMEE